MKTSEFAPVMITPKQLTEVFVVQGIENLYDEELAGQLGTSAAALNMMREAMFKGILLPPWLASNISRLLMEKAPLLETVKRVLEDTHNGF